MKRSDVSIKQTESVNLIKRNSFLQNFKLGGILRRASRQDSLKMEDTRRFSNVSQTMNVFPSAVTRLKQEAGKKPLQLPTNANNAGQQQQQTQQQQQQHQQLQQQQSLASTQQQIPAPGTSLFKHLIPNETLKPHTLEGHRASISSSKSEMIFSTGTTHNHAPRSPQSQGNASIQNLEFDNRNLLDSEHQKPIAKHSTSQQQIQNSKKLIVHMSAASHLPKEKDGMNNNNNEPSSPIDPMSDRIHKNVNIERMLIFFLIIYLIFFFSLRAITSYR